MHKNRPAITHRIVKYTFRLSRVITLHPCTVLFIYRTWKCTSIVSLRIPKMYLVLEPTTTCQEYWKQRHPTLECRIPPYSYLVRENFDIQALNTA